MKELSKLNKKIQSVIWLQYIGNPLQWVFLYDESTVFIIRLFDLSTTLGAWGRLGVASQASSTRLVEAERGFFKTIPV